MTRQTILGYTRPVQSGFGIIEIMIALALGVIIMLGVTQIATNNSNTRYELDRTGRQLENASYALREMESDISNAGYWGELGAQDAVKVPPVCPVSACNVFTDPLLSGASCELNWALAFPLQGGNAQFNCATSDVSDANKITPKAGTDYFASRRVNSCALGTAGCEAASGNFYLQVNSCFDPNNSAAPKSGIDYYIGTNTASLNYQTRKCDSTKLAPSYRLLNRIYYVNDNDQLVRAELVGTQYDQTTLVDGVELMRLEYGLDTTGDGQVDAYTDVPTGLGNPLDNPVPAPGWDDVVMVRISLVVRNESGSNGFTDTKTYTLAGKTYCASGCDVDIPANVLDHRRQLYQRTVSLRNVAGRRE